jgi:hypothetical protein
MRCLMPSHGRATCGSSNAIERAVALSGGRSQIEMADLTPEIQQASEMRPRLIWIFPRKGLTSKVREQDRARADSPRAREPAATKARHLACST